MRRTTTTRPWRYWKQPSAAACANREDRAAMSKRNKVFLGVGGGVLLIVLVMVSASAKRDKGIEVRFETVGRRDLVAAVTASGKIQPKKKVDISADITGRITRIAVREGDLVTRGQFLLQIDPTIYQANLEQAEATLASSQAAAVQAKANRDQAERALKRTKELRDQNPNLISPEQLEQAQTAFEVADANLTAVPSTFSKDIGLLMTISDLSVIQAKVKVDETDVVRLHLGDSVEVSIDAFPDTTFLGRVTKVSNSSVRDAATSATGQNDRAVDYDVEVTLDKPPTDIRPDLSATARIVTDTRREALSIPIIALTVREHKPVSTEARPVDTSTARKKKETEGVFVVEKGVATFRPVKVGVAGDEYFEVLDGLKESETIVAGPYQG